MEFAIPLLVANLIIACPCPDDPAVRRSLIVTGIPQALRCVATYFDTTPMILALMTLECGVIENSLVSLAARGIALLRTGATRWLSKFYEAI